MKLSHLSLAILSAIALSACGGGSNDQTTPDNDNPTTQPGDTGGDTGNNNKDDDGKDAVVTEEDKEISNPVGDDVVDFINLSESSTVASQQYLRSKRSTHDRINNPDESASATVLSDVSLDEQNPQLTNIVIARVNGKNAKDEPVKLALYSGSGNALMTSQYKSVNNNKTYGEDTLQDINKDNALVSWWGAERYYDVSSSTAKRAAIGEAGYVNYLTDLFDPAYVASNVTLNPLFKDSNDQAVATAYFKYVKSLRTYEKAYEKYLEKGNAANSTEATALTSAIASLNTAASELATKVTQSSNLKKYVGEDKLGQKIVDASKVKTYSAPVSKASYDNDVAALKESNKENTAHKFIDIDKLEDYGSGLATMPFLQSGFAAAGWGDEIDGDKVKGVDNGPTHGLVGIWTQQIGKKSRPVARGLEENNTRESRIFGHYYLDPGVKEDGQKDLNDESWNSWRRARTYITAYDKNGEENAWNIGAEPMTLNHVQYGRITAEIDNIDVAKYAATSGWEKVRQDDVNRDPKKARKADDFYFYRGTGATKIKEMAALPTDVTIGYEGHALMYGIDNTFHGAGKKLPNAFGDTNDYGLGNFVKAELDMGKKTFVGKVYNTWHSPDTEEVVHDSLVDFTGKVKGNTVIGSAVRSYIDNDKKADFRASFYGTAANEVGGAFNSVTDKEKFSDIGWGGVFGAKRGATGGSGWLVSDHDY